MQTQKPVIQTFFGKPVRFFKADFWVEEHCCNDNTSLVNFTLETTETRGRNDPSGDPIKRDHNDPSPIENSTETHPRYGNAPIEKLTETYHRDGGASIEKTTEENHRYGGAPIGFFTLETWAIPLPDYAKAIGYGVEHIWRIIQRSNETFSGFYRQETIQDTLGRRQKTILMAVEMCDMITARLQASRIKDPETRAAVIRFQRWVIMMFGLIRRGKLRPARWPKDYNTPHAYLTLCSIPSGRDLADAVADLAKQENRSETTIYRRLQQMTGENVTTRKGVPRKTRSEAGSHRKRPEYQMALDYKREHPKAGGAVIRQACGLSVSTARINAWLREGISIH